MSTFVLLTITGLGLGAMYFLVASGLSLIGSRATVSDESGRFRLLHLPVGTYQLAIRRLGHASIAQQDIVVSLGVVTDLGDVTLETAVVEVAAAGVTATRPARRATALGGEVSRAVFTQLPSDRDYQSIVTLLPHASASYFGDRALVAGTTGPESNYYVDGANVVEPPGNGVSTSLPYNLVEAVEVRAGAYDAEFGGAGGGVVNAVTASGGERFQGQVFGFFANRVLTSTAGHLGVTPKTEDYVSWDAGASVGGPLVRDRLIGQAATRPDWVLGYQDETWWTRLSQPNLSAWAGEQPLRLLPNERGGGKEALACYGLLRADTGAMLLRFVEGRPVGQVTEDYLGWLCGRFAAEGKRVFVLVWDNAAWHISERVRRWIERHNRRVRRAGKGCRIRVCGLPIKAPWLNPIEPKWVHGKRAIVEPDRKLTADQLRERVFAHFGVQPTEPLKQAVG